ncbi:hypothetical protein M378DRAFT_167772 [Amanita muscaria Koide BX008]|uniref:BTB domain-containing protein n=1 Tax=Amanita muscaria (strain Koide BX008) TaxID=946122 RepID=A0A0C2T2T2_AMAMK|nr:hypothetical protein M378DRAFT_167772 [Amanita muscaria Koide BX008]
MAPTVNASPRPTFANLIRSEIWFDDGNLLLIAGSAMFKVHRGQLQRHSEFFNTLFSLPQSRDQNLLDGCLWVELYDCPSDVLYFLKALYDGLYFKAPYANDFPALAAILRLSTKYFVEHLRQLCLARLSLDWPATLAGWDQRESAAIDKRGRYVPWLTCAHPILAMQLAIEQSIPSVFLAAMYDLSRYGPSKIQIGTRPLRLASDLLFSNLDAVAYNNQRITLSPELLCRTLKGREYSQKYLASFIERELQFRTPSEKCMNRSDEDNSSQACRDSFYYITLNVLRAVGGISSGRDADPLYTLLQAADMLTRMDFSDGQQLCGLKMCHACKVDFAGAVARAREEVWMLLPRWFGIPEVGARSSVKV